MRVPAPSGLFKVMYRYRFVSGEPIWVTYVNAVTWHQELGIRSSLTRRGYGWVRFESVT